ncbi:hypothetical protein VIGAN_06104100 [Vigna angularis var. angularis]|uniref:Diphthamide biosynthesis protein 1 n=1 Tax=Vigna angularis var. angularis TaxID=157739 RepID=A0A0S3SAK6_PHAAN|nr:hypothetical protein VIGAN_06104100 [Vigna angularis var. angularis]
MKERELDYTVVLMSELSLGRVTLFEDSVDAWIQIACPRLSIAIRQTIPDVIKSPEVVQYGSQCYECYQVSQQSEVPPFGFMSLLSAVHNNFDNNIA